MCQTVPVPVCVQAVYLPMCTRESATKKSKSWSPAPVTPKIDYELIVYAGVGDKKSKSWSPTPAPKFIKVQAIAGDGDQLWTKHQSKLVADSH